MSLNSGWPRTLQTFLSCSTVFGIKPFPLPGRRWLKCRRSLTVKNGKFKLEPSDWWYYAEKLRKQKYDLDDTELRPYFKLENVREGVFTCANKLFGITFTPIPQCPLPHPEAEAFEVKDSTGEHIWSPLYGLPSARQ